MQKPLDGISFNFACYFFLFTPPLYFIHDNVTITVSCINKRDARAGWCAHSLQPSPFEQRFNTSFKLAAGLTPCLKDRLEAYGLDIVPPPGRFVPECKRTGEYKGLQCHGSTGYCWCVDKNGKEIRGTRKRGSPPLCYQDGRLIWLLLFCKALINQ